VKAFCVAQILMMGWLCTRGETQPDTPDPLPAPGNSPAQSPAKDLSNIQWLDAEVIHKARQAVVAIQPDGVATSSSNGFFASADGLVVTSASSLEGNRRVVVPTLNKEEIKGARLMAIDAMTDLVVLATGRKKQAYLQVHDKPVAAGDSCAVIFHAGEGIFKTADGKLLGRREDLDWSEARFLEMWSVAVNPNMNGLTGAPVITRDGRVAGMCDLVNGAPPQKFVLAIPEAAIAAVLARARAARKPLEFPKVGEISRLAGLPDPTGDPDYMEAMKLSSAGNRAAALEKYRAVLKRHPQNPLVMNRLASCLASAGNEDEARKILEDAIRLAPERLGLQLMYGNILQAQGDSVKMIRHYQDLTTRFPKLGDAWGRLGQCLFQAGRQAEGLAAIRKWTELKPDSMNAWDTYAQALSATGNHDEADCATKRSAELESLFFKLRYSAPKRD
jgi:tetratricopeptide (TPR) repeat protein